MLVILDSTSLALVIDVKGNAKTAPVSNVFLNFPMRLAGIIFLSK